MAGETWPRDAQLDRNAAAPDQIGKGGGKSLLRQQTRTHALREGAELGPRGVELGQHTRQGRRVRALIVGAREDLLDPLEPARGSRAHALLELPALEIGRFHEPSPGSVELADPLADLALERDVRDRDPDGRRDRFSQLRIVHARGLVDSTASGRPSSRTTVTCCCELGSGSSTRSPCSSKYAPSSSTQ